MHCENSSTARRLNRAMFAAFAVQLGVFCAAPVFAQTLNPPYDAQEFYAEINKAA